MNPDTQTVQCGWEMFQKIIPPDAGAEQRREMKIAFYAGATSMFLLATDLSRHSDAAAEAILVGLWDECVRFKNDVLAGQV